VHSIGAGLVIFEIQQNSDTTYRVFDWNRKGLDGKPRALHIGESLASINFNDFEPGLIPGDWRRAGQARLRSLVEDPLFVVELYQAEAGARIALAEYRMQIIGVTEGRVQIQDQTAPVVLSAGDFSLIPAAVPQAFLEIQTDATFLRVEASGSRAMRPA
jgi:mannose-6-phosphate isomerase